jgi:hypothetical protein
VLSERRAHGRQRAGVGEAKPRQAFAEIGDGDEALSSGGSWRQLSRRATDHDPVTPLHTGP